MVSLLLRPRMTTAYDAFIQFVEQPPPYKLKNPAPEGLGFYDLFILRRTSNGLRTVQHSKDRKRTLAEFAKVGFDPYAFAEALPVTNDLQAIFKTYRERTLTKIDVLRWLRDPFETTKGALKTLISLAGISVGDLLGFISANRYPFLSEEARIGSIPPDQKKLPKITNLNDPLQLYPIALLGVGGFGAVFIVWIWGYGKAVIKIPSYRDSGILSLKVECENLERLCSGSSSPNVMCPKACPINSSAIIMDYYEGYADLLRWRNCSRKLGSAAVASKEYVSILATIFRQVLSGVEFIHAKGLAHRDIKPGNILVKWDVPMIIDFGGALPADALVRAPYSGTLSYLPREIMEARAAGVKDLTKLYPLHKGADVYGVGASLYAVIHRTQPYYISKFPETMEEIDKIYQKPLLPVHANLKPLERIYLGLMAPVGLRWTAAQAMEELAKLEKIN